MHVIVSDDIISNVIISDIIISNGIISVNLLYIYKVKIIINCTKRNIIYNITCIVNNNKVYKPYI